jgi:Fe-S-cluster containining protein
MENLISNEICRRCGECCKNFPYIDLTDVEIDVLEGATTLPPEVFTYPKGEAAEGHFMQFQANGDCYFLDGTAGCYSCGVYQTRPGICKSYPSEPKQEEACWKHREKSLSKLFD